MTTSETRRRNGDAATRTNGLQKLATRLVRHLGDAVRLGRATGATIAKRLPGTVATTRARAHETTNALQTLPDPTLRGLAATSVGLGAGFYLAGAPRVVVAAGVAPAVIMGAAILLRPIEPLVTAEADRWPTPD